MSNSTVVLPLDADRIYIEQFVYEARGVWLGPEVSSVGLDIGYSYDGDLTRGYFYFYLVVAFRIKDADNTPAITAALSLTGEFTPRFGSFPEEASQEKIEEWIGANAISLMYAKAANIVEQQLNSAPINHIALPAINPYTVWKQGEIEDGEFWTNVDAGDIIRAFSDLNHADPAETSLDVQTSQSYEIEPGEVEGDHGSFEDSVDRGLDRGTEGIWILTDDGRFELNEQTKIKLMNARLAATQAWRDALLDYLEENSQYSWDELNIELLRRCKQDLPATQITEEFILEALSGDL